MTHTPLAAAYAAMHLPGLDAALAQAMVQLAELHGSSLGSSRSSGGGVDRPTDITESTDRINSSSSSSSSMDASKQRGSQEWVAAAAAPLCAVAAGLLEGQVQLPLPRCSAQAQTKEGLQLQQQQQSGVQQAMSTGALLRPQHAADVAWALARLGQAPTSM
eukprot:scaffold163328_cov17-Tisochrysis_lutea.AAC.1